MISVIIPTYNRAELLVEALKSVLRQTYTDWECIIIDDGSDDDTERLVKTYSEKDSRFSYYKRPDCHLSGGNGARNYGFQLSKGDYINWLDSDDIFHSRKLELQIQHLVNNNLSVSVCMGQLFEKELGDCNGQYWSDWIVTKRGINDALILQKMRWPTGAVLWCKESIKDTDWQESLKGGQEWLFHIKATLSIPENKIGFINESLIYIRNLNDSITRSNKIVWRYQNYLIARVKLLNLLRKRKPKYYQEYFFYTYNFSLKYVKVLINANQFKSIFYFGKIVLDFSVLFGVRYFLGVIIYKLIGKSYFLKLKS